MNKNEIKNKDMIKLVISHNEREVQTFTPTYKINDLVYRVELVGSEKDKQPKVVKYNVRDIILRLVSPKNEYGSIIDLHNCLDVTTERADEFMAENITIAEFLVLGEYKDCKVIETTLPAKSVYPTPEEAVSAFSETILKQYKP